MGFFDKLLGGKKQELGAPVAGEAVPSREVDDPTFAGDMLGRGMAIRPASGRIIAPCDAVVDMVFETGHAVTIKTGGGAEVLIHVGIDTVKLRGKHFAVRCRAGERVKRGQPLIEFDREAIEREGYDPVVAMVVCNSEAFGGFEAVTGRTVDEGETVIRLNR